jgi:anaerobic selenocysteine-containing dehydrogenase
VQEVSADTDTAAHADLLLPAAGWGEKEGTVTNSERRISRVRAAVPAPGEARADWRIAATSRWQLESRLGHAAADTLFPYAERRGIFNEHRASDRRPRPRHRRPLLRPAGPQSGPQQWPLRAGAACSANTRASTPTACFPPPAAAPASHQRSTSRRRSRPTRAIRCISTPAACATSGTA